MSDILNRGDDEAAFGDTNSVTVADLTSEEALAALRLTIPKDKLDALEKFPHLKEKVTVDYDGVIVETDKGNMRFAFKHDANIQDVKSDENLSSNPFSHNQLVALVELFGEKPQPYLELLGFELKDGEYLAPGITALLGKRVSGNFYWSNTRVGGGMSNCVWGISINEDEVKIVHNTEDSKCSSFSSF